MERYLPFHDISFLESYLPFSVVIHKLKIIFALASSNIFFTLNIMALFIPSVLAGHTHPQITSPFSQLCFCIFQPQLLRCFLFNSDFAVSPFSRSQHSHLPTQHNSTAVVLPFPLPSLQG